MITMTKKLENLMRELKKTNSETFYHCIRTKRYTNKMIDLMNGAGVTQYSQEETDIICMGAMLHDMGKLNVRNFVLTKDGSLTEEEKENIKKHPGFGWEMLKDEIPESEQAIIRDICLYHHERIDGSGYEGKTDIPLYVQLVSVCDVFDALHSDRIYRRGYSVEKSLGMIKDRACGGFSETVVGFLEQVVRALENE